MKRTMIELAEAGVQMAVLVALYPIWFLVGLYARMTRFDRFDRTICRVCGLWLFPAFGRWWMPMVWLNWHY